MSSYYELSTLAREVYGTCATMLMLLTIFLLVTVCMLHMKKIYWIAAFTLEVLVLLLLQGITDVSYNCETGHEFSFLATSIGKLPYIVVAVSMFTLVVAEILFIVYIFYKKQNMLTPRAIKESLDALPDGVCFFDKDGQPLLINMQMHRINQELFDRGILNVNIFWNKLKNKAIDKNAEVVSTEPTIMVCTRDEKVWDFHKNVLKIGKTKVQELIAYDVTEQYRLSQELKQKNQSLAKVNERLKVYSNQVEHITREKEILAAKIRVHDDVGRSLLAFRSYLEQPKESRNRDGLILMWRHTISVLKKEVLPEQQCNDWDLLKEAAEAVDVTIEKTGELPEDKKKRAVIITAIYECLTNTVKHAKGNKLFICIRSDEKILKTEIRNNGKIPEGEIRETGGLKNLRHSVETVGGEMSIESTPCFVLHLQFPRGEQ